MEDENPHADLDILPLRLRRIIARLERQPEVQEREQRLRRQNQEYTPGPFPLPLTYRGMAERMAEVARRRQQRRQRRKGQAH